MAGFWLQGHSVRELASVHVADKYCLDQCPGAREGLTKHVRNEISDELQRTRRGKDWMKP